MHPNDAPLISDAIMQALLQMLKSNSGKASAVQEDALVAIGTLVEGSYSDLIELKSFLSSFNSIGNELSQIYRTCSSIPVRSIE